MRPVPGRVAPVHDPPELAEDVRAERRRVGLHELEEDRQEGLPHGRERPRVLPEGREEPRRGVADVVVFREEARVDSPTLAQTGFDTTSSNRQNHQNVSTCLLQTRQLAIGCNRNDI